MDLSQFKKIFINEAESLLFNLDNIIVDLEKDADNKSLLNEVFRVMHTIKGAAGMYGFDYVVEITHEMETIYSLIRNGQHQLSREVIDLTLKTSDHIKQLLIDEKLEDNINRENHSQLLSYLKTDNFNTTLEVSDSSLTIKNSSEKSPSQLSTWNILFYPSDEIVKRAINLIYPFQDLFQLGEYKINHIPSEDVGSQYWSIFLVTDKGFDEIENALMFIMDYCKIVNVADFNIFNTEGYKKREALFNIKEEEIPTPIKMPQVILNQDQNLTATKVGKTTHINVDATKLDTLMYLVSELVTTKSELVLALQKQNYTKACDAAEKIEKLTKGFSENALNIRLITLQDMMLKFKRVIRDLSQQLGKNVDFKYSGDDTELDKSIIDSINEPIMHIIRNCVDHGIEMPEIRLAANKSEVGTIYFEAHKTGNFVYITISDDGKGIDPQSIFTKAVEKGFIDADAKLSEKEILDLIFLPGFSTAQTLTNISGRGVGMDVVLKRIQEIRGEITLQSIKGQGTSFVFKLQQTISIIDTLLFQIDEVVFAAPLEDIEACEILAIEHFASSSSRYCTYEETLIPYLDLNHLVKGSTIFNAQMSQLAVIINKQGRKYALLVNSIIGEFQAVIKPIGKAFNDIKFISGASLLGDGSIAILLDTEKLWYEIK